METIRRKELIGNIDIITKSFYVYEKVGKVTYIPYERLDVNEPLKYFYTNKFAITTDDIFEHNKFNFIGSDDSLRILNLSIYEPDFYETFLSGIIKQFKKYKYIRKTQI